MAGRRSRVVSDAIARGIALVGEGVGMAAAAEEVGLAAETLRKALIATPSPPAPATSAPLPTPAGVPIDASGDPLAIARALLGSVTAAIAAMPADSIRLNPARGEARALAKLVAGLERERAAEESPEEQSRRLRREDGDVRRRIERYVSDYEAEAARPRDGAPFGVCVHCGAPRQGEP